MQLVFFSKAPEFCEILASLKKVERSDNSSKDKSMPARPYEWTD